MYSSSLSSASCYNIWSIHSPYQRKPFSCYNILSISEKTIVSCLSPPQISVEQSLRDCSQHNTSNIRRQTLTLENPIFLWCIVRFLSGSRPDHLKPKLQKRCLALLPGHKKFTWNPWNLSFHYIHCSGQFTPKMTANAEPRLLSSLVWIDSGAEVSQHRLESFLMK